MKTQHELNKEVALAGGGDFTMTSAQAQVDLHIHHAAAAEYISQRQRKALARKAFNIQAKTGTDKLKIYRRLMSVFDFRSVDVLPQAKYSRVMAYLDAWLKSGTESQVPASRSFESPVKVVSPESASDSTNHIVIETKSELIEPTLPARVMPPMKAMVSVSLMHRLVFAGAALLAVVAIASYAAGPGQSFWLPFGLTFGAAKCQYAGHRYSIGSVMIQAGRGRQCVAAIDDSATWEALKATAY
jgi:hypothetical protein